jgi:hypothetical protein
VPRVIDAQPLSAKIAARQTIRFMKCPIIPEPITCVQVRMMQYKQ